MDLVYIAEWKSTFMRPRLISPAFCSGSRREKKCHRPCRRPGSAAGGCGAEEGEDRPLGMDARRIWVADDFDAPLPDELLKEFYGGTLPKIDRKSSPETQMKYLLDTMVWLWSVGPSEERIGTQALKFCERRQEEIYLSAASSWEIAIKTRSVSFNFPRPPGSYRSRHHGRAGHSIVRDHSPHSLQVYDLPSHHGDPFDRMIIAQAMVEEMTVLTSDRVFEKYPIDVVWCGK